MRPMLIFLLSISTVLLRGLYAAESPTDPQTEDLDGREVVVRLYEKPDEDPGRFNKAVVQVRGRTVRFSFDDLDESAFVAVFGQDQEDEVIKDTLAESIYGWAYKKGLELSLPEASAGKEEDYWWSFVDGTGNPIPNAEVEIWLWQLHRQIHVASGDLDSRGGLRTAFHFGHGRATLRRDHWGPSYAMAACRFVVSHPEHGTAIVDAYGDDDGKHPHTIFVPVVPAGSEAEKRSIWGAVVDGDNNPVGAAFVQASSLHLHGGEYVGSVRAQRAGVLTDAQGRFRLYLPTSGGGGKIGTLVPPKAKYYVIVKPPKGLGLLEFRGEIPNGQESKIALESAGHFRTFVFEDENGPIKDPKTLKRIRLHISRPGKRDLWFKRDDWKAGGKFPLGTYEAEVDTPFGYTFEPIEVTADSPEQLVFRLPGSRTYYGQVLHGITGEPMEGAFVIDTDGMCSQRNLSMATRDQWDALSELPTFPSANERALGQLQQGNYYGFTKLVRTDENGWFEMIVPPKREFYNLAVFQEDYLTVFGPRVRLKADERNGVAVPLIRLFPAAKVIVEPRVERWTRGLLSIQPKWIVDQKDSPGWVQAFLAACKQGQTEGIRQQYSLRPNKPQSFYVPAGLSLQIQLRIPYRKALSAVTIAERVNLQQGEVLDLGRQEIQLAVRVFAAVVDSGHNAVGGVPVTALSTRYKKMTRYTDENGIA